jgi:hypothetical protein
MYEPNLFQRSNCYLALCLPQKPQHCHERAQCHTAAWQELGVGTQCHNRQFPQAPHSPVCLLLPLAAHWPPAAGPHPGHACGPGPLPAYSVTICSCYTASCVLLRFLAPMLPVAETWPRATAPLPPTAAFGACTSHMSKSWGVHRARLTFLPVVLGHSPSF